MSIIVSDLSYRYPNRQSLFGHISFSVPCGGKVSVIGNNGTGKSTLLKLLAGELGSVSGAVRSLSKPYYIPQLQGSAVQDVSGALGVADKINALNAICDGSSEQGHYDILADDWDIESRCRAALDFWDLPHIRLRSFTEELSGGERTKVFLAGLMVHEPDIILLDEPTNHLDLQGRRKLYDYLDNVKATVVVVSHDVALLNMMDATYELSPAGLRSYGGNYDFYRELKALEDNALSQKIGAEESALRRARRKASEVKERQERRIEHAAKTTSGIPRIVLNSLRSKGENSSAALAGKHSAIISESRRRINSLRLQRRPDAGLKIDFDNAGLHNGKLLVSASDANFGYAGGDLLWRTPLNVEIRSGERIHITGGNGSGKTTLLRLLTGGLSPARGEVRKADFSFVYLDQQYDPVDRDMTLLELTREHNRCNLLDHEIKLRLDRALFPVGTWDKNCRELSGGERMRLYLCCLMISNHVPDMFVLDEPTNNLDLSSLSILADTVKNYSGTLLVVSHDRNFINEIRITRCIELA